MDLRIATLIVDGHEIIATCRHAERVYTVKLSYRRGETPEAAKKRIAAAVRSHADLATRHRGRLAALVGQTITLADPPDVTLTRTGDLVTGMASPGSWVMLRLTDQKGQREIVLRPNKVGVISVMLASGTTLHDFVACSRDGLEGPVTPIGDGGV